MAISAQKLVAQQVIAPHLRILGANLYDLSLPETRTLLYLLDPDETPLGLVYGRYHYADKPVGRGLLVATNSRIMLIDKKPLYLNFNEISYSMVSGVEYAHIGLVSIVALSTHKGDVRVRTFNSTCARRFVAAVERKIFTQQGGELNGYFNK